MVHDSLLLPSHSSAVGRIKASILTNSCLHSRRLGEFFGRIIPTKFISSKFQSSIYKQSHRSVDMLGYQQFPQAPAWSTSSASPWTSSRQTSFNIGREFDSLKVTIQISPPLMCLPVILAGLRAPMPYFLGLVPHSPHSKAYMSKARCKGYI